MSESANPVFQSPRSALETVRAPSMLELLHIDNDDLPVIWDTDFLCCPKLESGLNTYVLCEINASSVCPYPPSAPEGIARAVARQLTRISAAINS